MSALLFMFTLFMQILHVHSVTYIQLKNGFGHCLDSNGGTALIDTYGCVAASASDIGNELFRLNPVGTHPSTYALAVFANPDLCVTSSICDKCSGIGHACLCTTLCNATDEMQQWTQSMVTSKTFSLSSHVNQCITAVSQPGAVSLTSCTNASGQVWTVNATVTPQPPPSTNLHINGHSVGHVFDGIGLLSAGASSRYLIDYPEPQRSQILDYLFKPNFGASLNMIKVEIGGDCQSTSGTESSHMHSRDDLGCSRGYEGWLMAEAKKRNPNIKTWGLSWGVPAWIGGGEYFSSDNIAYQTKWLQCVKSSLGIAVDYIGIWNERPYGPMDYTINLRKSLDEARISTKIVLPDGGISQTLVDQLNTNKSFSDAVYAVGQHGCGHISWTGDSESFSQKWWCTESEVSNGWDAARSWGPTLNENFIRANQTSTTSWSLLWSVPVAISEYQNRGAMLATEPWSGHYYVDATIYMHAHWTQMADIGWTILGVAGNGSGGLSGGGSYCTLVSPDGNDYSVVIERLQFTSATAQNITLVLTNLPTSKPLQLWKTNEESFFQPDTSQPIIVNENTVSFVVQGAAIYSLTTLTTPTHGTFADPIPASASFPLPYTDDFDAYANDTLAKYFADQGGSFAAIKDGDETVLSQRAPADPGPNAWVKNADPVTLIGDNSWANYTVKAMVKTISQSSVSLSDDSSVVLAPCHPTLKGQRWDYGNPDPEYFRNVDTQLCLNQFGCGRDSKIIEYQCIRGIGAGCAGVLSNLRWKLSPASQLIINVTGQCVTASGGSATTSDCITPVPATQKWTYDNTSGMLSNGGNCLSVPPVLEYAAVCGRVKSFAAFGGSSANKGMCLRLFGRGEWSVLQGTTVVANGTTSVIATNWNQLGLQFEGTTATALINGAAVATSIHVNDSVGMAALGSSYSQVYFDNFSVTSN
eukprot:m.243730 g.243730  ORF g.243730 m.243730 type:complete len:926 (-) comp33818_c0_seq1:380-3157(-)